jgi:hypothetical protein
LWLVWRKIKDLTFDTKHVCARACHRDCGRDRRTGTHDCYPK